MHNISTTQLLSLWTELEACYYDTNKYGGHIAEIYMTAILPGDSCLHALRRNEAGPMLAELANEKIRGANESFLQVLKHFENTHNGAKITLEEFPGRELGPWFVDEGMWHRLHVIVRTPHAPWTEPEEKKE